MLRKTLFFVFLTLSILLAACASPAPTDTPTVEENPSENAETSGEYTMYFPLSGSKGNTSLPSEAPVTEWNTAGGAIPIMAGATAGQEGTGNYAFTTNVGVAEVEAYYLQELAARGWTSLSIGESMEVKNLLFELGDTRVTIYIKFLADQNLTYVVIEG